MSNHGPIILQADQVTKSYHRAGPVPVLRGVDLQVQAGEFLCIVGASGSGKSTLLHVLGTLDQPDTGSVSYMGERIDNQSRRHRDRFRNEIVGYVFQFYHLLPELDALENVLLPAYIRQSVVGYWLNRASLKTTATEMLHRVGLGHRMHHKPREMSGGEMQRAAIARALVSQPKILLADEPTGNLDRANGIAIVTLLKQLQTELGITIVMVTHDAAVARQADRRVEMEDGLLLPHTNGGDDPLSHFPRVAS